MNPHDTSRRQHRISCAYWLFMLISLGAFVPAKSQNIRFERLSVEQGLSSANVNYILQDRRKMLWFGTEDGLNRYDGITFTTFRQTLPDSLGIGAHSITSIYEDYSGVLWLATANRRTVSRFSPFTSRFDAFLFPSSTETIAQAFVEQRNGTIFVGTKNGLFAASGTNTILQRVKNIPTTLDIRGMVRDTGDVFWLACSDGGIYRFNATESSLSKAESRVQGNITTFTPQYDSASQKQPSALWLGTRDNGLWAYLPAERRTIRFSTEEGFPGKNVRSICAASRDEIWVGTDNGVAIMRRNRSNGSAWSVAEHLTHDLRNEKTLSANLIQHILKDSSGVVWVGTAFYGVSKYSPFKQKFQHFAVNLLKDNSSLNSAYVRDIAQEGDNLWLATQTGGVNRLNRKTGVWTYFRRDKIATDTAWALRLDRKGQLWLGTVGNGLWRWDAAKQAFVRFSGIPANTSIQLLYEDRQGTLWATGDGAPLYGIAPDRTTQKDYLINLAGTNTSSGKRILSMLETAQGQILLGLPTGIMEFDRTQGTMRRLLPRYAIRAMIQDSRGDLWLGTRGQGLLHYRLGKETLSTMDTTKIFAITEREGVPSNLVSAIVEDSSKHLWVSTKQGLAEIDIETRKVMRAFDMDDGLQGREFHHGSVFQCAEGEIFFGGTNGFNTFFPRNVLVNTVAPPIEITSVKKFGRDEMLGDSTIAKDRSITLRYDESTVSFSFVALDFNTPEANVYAYRLEGLDKGWIRCGTRREATYTSLDAGEYVFTVRAANNDGTWNEAGTSFRVIITPPIWRTWWFIGLSVASIVCIGFVLYRMRIRSIEARNAWLEKQVEDRTAEIKEKNKELQQSLDEIKILSSVLEGERNKSEDLLLNILPSSIAERLKWGETTIVDTFESATVIFTDMVGFTKIASKVSAEELIVILNRMFSEFDKLAEKHGVEKIKTIGDAYMAVAGVPIPNDFHAEAVADMALDIMLAIKDLAEKENLPISIRAGIHTGYLTAGVIGEKKFAYDLWGDTVNTASRMESSGEPGRVQCSEATYLALKDTFDFEERGTIEVKGKGAMKTYFVLGRK
ncbi:MAG: adenylate/guanylate cyclase domain-containing protein [Candidatus Kapaibacteriota bacterium]